MTVQELIVSLSKLPQDKQVVCQVVAEDNTVWNCWYDFNDIERSQLVQLRIHHDELKTLNGVNK